jgi:hypothetical protein
VAWGMKSKGESHQKHERQPVSRSERRPVEFKITHETLEFLLRGGRQGLIRTQARRVLYAWLQILREWWRTKALPSATEDQ